MATLKQKALAAKLLENVGKGRTKPAKQIMIESGYTESMAEGKAKKVLASKGVIETLAKHGITHDALSKKFKQLLNSSEGDRIQLDTAKFCAVMTKMSETDGEGNAGMPAVNIYLPAHEVTK